ncbi:lysosomal alpha-mannosidase-like [Dreissena polymorpha]|uniref:lysosomal alpha-mannosidase-like n=1 Tax=Dreissena polymorpha TaxID=45954 RepID=UPI0022650357|nr:lysosomal alpha-mannosidase-like [Dreissena polymorpha]
MSYIWIRVFVAVSCYASGLPAPASHQCGYKSCHPVKDDMLNVHIVPHTHDDVGWVKTIAEYYNQDVSYIISSVVESLSNDKTGMKKFIYVEMAFLKMWWTNANDEARQKFKHLVDKGSLEIILGGWCMNDEATPYYLDIIDQHSLGFEFIRLNLGECGRPKIGWQIDPFGHSRELGSLFAQFGFDGMFVGRIDYQDKQKREATKTLEMVWKTSDSLGEYSDLFVGVLDNVYWPPQGFCWDYWCGDRELVSGSDAYVQSKVDDFIGLMKAEGNRYATNHVMVEMGSDFQYRDADKWYRNLDMLIEKVNARQSDPAFKMNLLYSNPACYLYQLNLANRTWTTKSDDFFPYAHRAHSFWTGYFTSRPNLKRLVRTAGALLQTCKQLSALTEIPLQEYKEIDYLKEAMAVVQHHDGVSGTEKQYVSDDYTKLLQNGISYCKNITARSLARLMTVNKSTELTSVDLVFCPQLDLARCDLTEKEEKFTVAVYNPLARSRLTYVRIPVSKGDFSVRNASGSTIGYQKLPITRQTELIPDRGPSLAVDELVFPALLPPLGFTTFTVEKVDATKDTANAEQEWLEEKIKELAEQSFGPQPYSEAVEIIENQFYTVSVSRETGQISRIWNKKEDVAVALKQNFFYYVAHDGNNFDADGQASGAYIFRPTSNNPTRANDGTVVVTAYKGGHVQEIRQVFCDWISQVIRLYDNSSHIELEWTVGPIPSGSLNEGREVVTNYMTDLETNGVFYTDLNGRETLQRKRDHRDTWELNQTESVSGNYFPITTKAFLRDEHRGIQLTVLVDRSEGAASIKDGHMEVMVHRRTFHDDSLGVVEPLTELGAGGKGIVARGTHYLMLNKITSAAAVHRPLYQEIYFRPHVTFMKNAGKHESESGPDIVKQWSGTRLELPPNINLLTLDLWVNPVVPTNHAALLVRLEHAYEKYEHDSMSNPKIVNLKYMFKQFEILDVIELTLGANMRKSDVDRLQWRTQDQRPSHTRIPLPLNEGRSVELSPMEIRTFQINVRYPPN